jgi:hypothetical protein
LGFFVVPPLIPHFSQRGSDIGGRPRPSATFVPLLNNLLEKIPAGADQALSRSSWRSVRCFSTAAANCRFRYCRFANSSRVWALLLAERVAPLGEHRLFAI